MLIPASTPAHRRTSVLFQSLDWVDVDSGLAGLLLFLIGLLQFQSLDWVDVYSGPTPTGAATKPAQFQSLDWVDVYSGNRRSRAESS